MSGEGKIPSSLAEDDRFQFSEVFKAGRNHAVIAELLELDVTPIDGHYQLVHFDVPVIDESQWSLSIEGEVASPLRLSLDELRAMPRLETQVTLECAGNGRTLMSPRAISQPWITGGVSTASWAGVSLVDVLRKARVFNKAKHIVFSAIDRGVEGGMVHNYARSLTVQEAMDGPILAYEMNGVPLPRVHGYPLRLVCPGWYGMASVKWLSEIRAVEKPGFLPQQDVHYRIQRDENDKGTPVTRMLPRSLIIPPGLPDQFRNRYADPGRMTVVGRAWSGFGPIVRVEISENDGKTWREAELFAGANPYAWQKFQFEWDARPGDRRLISRATDSAGNVQPMKPDWNLQGMANNAVSSVEVTVGFACPRGNG